MERITLPSRTTGLPSAHQARPQSEQSQGQTAGYAAGAGPCGYRR
jgi:hypothetical protein